MKRLTALTVATVSLLCMGVSFPAAAQGLKEKVMGTWTLESASENFPDGKKLTPWAKGDLILDSTGHVALFLIGRDRPNTSPSVRTPVGPAVAYFGTYSVNEADNSVTYKIDYGVSPLFDGAVRTQKVSFTGDTMTMIGSEIKTPEGTMTPVHVWKRAK